MTELTVSRMETPNSTAIPKKVDLTYRIEGNKKKKLFDVIEDSDIWEYNGLNIIGLVGIQKICNTENIVEKNIRTEITPTNGNKQQHVVNIWVGLKGETDPDNWTRGSGEASILNTGKVMKNKKGERRYEEFDCIDSKYRYSMADKRAFCRAVLKFIQLTGVYSDVEAIEFSNQTIKNYDY